MRFLDKKGHTPPTSSATSVLPRPRRLRTDHVPCPCGLAAAKARRSASRRGALWRFATPAAAAVAASCALVGAGEVLPDAAAALVAAVAAAHRPLLLLGAGVAALPPKEAAPGQLRPVVDLLAAKCAPV